MRKERWMKIIILMIAVVFVSTAVHAKSSRSDSKEDSKSWWHMPYYLMKNTVKEIKTLQRKISNLYRKTERLEQRKLKLEEELSVLETDIKSLQERKNAVSVMNPNDDGGNQTSNSMITTCPRCCRRRGGLGSVTCRRTGSAGADGRLSYGPKARRAA